MKRILTLSSILIPASLLLVFWLVPELDPVIRIPLLHFYLVTFFTFAAIVVAAFTSVALGRQARPRHRLLATAFAAMASLFFVHGVTTPGAILVTFNPAISWAAWLTLFIGGLIFAVAAFDTPAHRLRQRQLRVIHWGIGLFCLSFILIAIFAPELLAALDERAAPWHQQLVSLTTFTLWLWAAIRLALTWNETRNPVDGTMVLLAIWFMLGAVSLHGFPTWQLSWWLYHIQLLLGAITAIAVLVTEYEQLRHFRLTTYYAVIGLILTAAMALIVSYFFSQLVERNLAPQLSEGELILAVVETRRSSLLIAGVAMGLLYALMLIVVRRADHLITRRNEELALAYTELQAAEAMRDDMTDMIVHDLRSPLTAISLSLDLLQSTLSDARKAVHQPKLVARSQSAVTHMMALINQLLDVARLESGQLKIHPRPFMIHELVHDLTVLFGPIAETNGKTLLVEAESDLPALVADREQIERVLDNLISNALKYTSAGDSIELGAHRERSNMLLQVRDSGAGIDPQAAAHIFDKFYQVKDEEGRALRQGTGLGLAFCKLVVEAHQGQIWVVSSPGQGSTFSFTLPLNAEIKQAPDD